jgi:predicted enzyme related to lactoylglutathione lyase
MEVTETFIAVEITDMKRATAFYVAALGATVMFASKNWSSLRIAGVRIGLALSPAYAGGRTGLHFAVADLREACKDVEGAGGRTIALAVEVAPGVWNAEVADTEGNAFTLTRR